MTYTWAGPHQSPRPPATALQAQAEKLEARTPDWLALLDPAVAELRAEYPDATDAALQRMVVVTIWRTVQDL